MAAEQLIYTCALAIAGLFTGGSLFISLVDVPARAALDPLAGREHFRQMYPRATALQAPLAAGGSITALALWLLTGSPNGLLAGLALGAVVVYTLVVLMPVNRLLMDSSSELQAADIVGLLDSWSKKHAVRTVLGGIAYLVLLVA